MDGHEVMNPHASIKLFAMCDAMKWNHLPVAGGLYDQNPEFLEQIQYIFAARSAAEERERQKKDRKMGPTGRVAGRRGR